jgi:hypothetical protein
MGTAAKKGDNTNSGEVEVSDFQSYHIIISKLSNFQQKVMRHAKKQESMDCL